MPLSSLTPLPADLPENWEDGQTISAGGVEAGLTIQHGYNYLSKQINDVQSSANEIDANASAQFLHLTPRVLSFSLPASGWTACTSYGGSAYSGGDLWQQSTESAGVTALTCLTVLADNALARQMENDGATALWPETAEGSVTFYVRGAKLTADMALSCLAQETGAPSEPQAPQENGEGEQG